MNFYANKADHCIILDGDNGILPSSVIVIVDQPSIRPSLYVSLLGTGLLSECFSSHASPERIGIVEQWFHFISDCQRLVVET